MFIILITGKLFYYKIHIPSNDIKDIKINEAGDNKLPDWLYFDKDKLEIVGIPLIKGLHFIELQFEKSKLIYEIMFNLITIFF